MTLDNNFKFFIPGIDIEKSKDERGIEIMRVQGIASVDKKDTDQEILKPSGFDLSYFKKSGFINYNHQAKNDPSAIIGEPEASTKITKDGEFFVSAKLYSKSKKAKEVYELAETLKGVDSTRKLGWSIEGKVLERDPFDEKIVTRALITAVAITPTPKCPGTWLDIVKGNFTNEDYIYEEQVEEKTEDGTVFGESYKPENGGQFYILDITKENGDRILVDKQFNIKIVKKSLTTSDAGAALKKEDLESQLKFPGIVVKSLLTIQKGIELGIIPQNQVELVIKEIKEKQHLFLKEEKN